MRTRQLFRKVCPCGQAFTTSNAHSIYHSKSCSAKFRSARDGMPIYVKPSSIDALKNFRAGA